MLTFKLLGNVELWKNGELLQGFRSQKELALLIYLAQTGQPQRRDVVAELLWDSGSTKQALSNVRTALARLQKQVGDALIVTQKTLALLPELRQQADSVKLLQTLKTVEHITSAEQAFTLQNALDSYQGDFLADLQLRNAPLFEQWVIETREYIRRQVITAYQMLGRYALSTGEPPWGMAIANRWLQVEQLDEAAHQLLIQMSIKAGNIREATSYYEQYAALLQTELGIEPAEELTALIRKMKSARPVVGALTGSARPQPIPATRHNIPAPYDQFFGRQHTLQELEERLGQPWCRLLTIVGQGGVGKSRLATTVARNQLHRYRDGVWLVELVDVDPHDDNLAESVAVEIASVLDLRFVGASPPIEQLLNHLQHKQMLLVLDNFEHVLPAFQIVLDIVQRCEQVQLVVTSRESLHLRVEWTVPLEGLYYPRHDSDADTTEAVELFLARRAQQQRGALSDDELTAIRSICRLVEGLPLAIELAAILTRNVSPQAIVDRLHHGFDVLTSSLRDIPERHNSLQIVFEMSWRTLPLMLQQRMAQLSVFRGGFDGTAAQQIAEASAQHLAVLVAKSLLIHNPQTNRYHMHPIIRAYAAEKLTNIEQFQQLHAHYYLALLAQHAEPLQRSRPQASIALLEPDIDNVRLAWQTGVAQRRSDWLLPALPALSTYYQMRGLAQEGESVMQAATSHSATWGAEGARFALRAGLERARFQNRLGSYWPATLSIKAALDLAEQNQDDWAKGMSQVLWGESLWRLGDYKSARNRLRQAQNIAREIGADLITAWCHHHLGIIDDIQGHYNSAFTYLQRASAIWRSLDNANALSVSLNSIGLVCLHLGELSAAQDAMEHALELCLQLDNRHMHALLLNNLSIVLTKQGDYAGAQQYLRRGVDLAVATGNLTGQSEIYISFGKNLHLSGDFQEAIQKLKQGLQIAEALGNRPLTITAIQYLAQLKNEQGELQAAEQLYHQALQIARQGDLPHTQCDLLIDLAELLRPTRHQHARQYVIDAIALAHTVGNAQLTERVNALANALQVPTNIKERNKFA